MSAIVGIYQLNGGSPRHSDLEDMLDIMAIRGPNGKGIWAEGPIGLGHRMLWTTSESLNEIQPLKNNNSDIIITADARIDNREELIRRLCPDIDANEPITDSQLILRAYLAWGYECPSKLIGDFAFAIWDKRREELFCARDHMGVKPFYYHLSENIFIFATEIKALFCLQEVPRKINENMIKNFMLRSLDDRVITFFDGVLRLPAAHVIIIKKNKFEQKKYWSLDSYKELCLPSDEDYAMRFRDIFVEAVRCRLRTAFPVGMQLSGGLDSSSIVCVADSLSQNKEKGKTFSAIFNQTMECDERQYIKLVTAERGLDPYFIIADLISPLGEIQHKVKYLDEPFLVPNIFILWSLCQGAKEENVRIFLTGEDGDTVVSHGLELLTQLADSGRSNELAKAIEDVSKNQNLDPHMLALDYCILFKAPEILKDLARKKSFPIIEIINPLFAEKVHLQARIEELIDQRDPATSAREAHCRALSSGFIQYILEFLDQLGAIYQMEFRHPFYDKRFVEFCLSLPPDQKLRSGWSRWILRNAMTNILPSEIQWRKSKSDLGQNFVNQLHDADLDLIRETIFQDSQITDRYFSKCGLEKIYNNFKLNPSEKDGMTLWMVVFLLKWLAKEDTGLENISTT